MASVYVLSAVGFLLGEWDEWGGMVRTGSGGRMTPLLAGSAGVTVGEVGPIAYGRRLFRVQLT